MDEVIGAEHSFYLSKNDALKGSRKPIEVLNPYSILALF